MPKKNPANPVGRNSVIKNAYRVFQMLLNQGSITTGDIADELNIAKGQAWNYLKALDDLGGLIKEKDRLHSGPGAAEMIYSLKKKIL